MTMSTTRAFPAVTSSSRPEGSLRRLKTDYLDLYQIHRPHPEVAIDETLRALDDLVRTGKVRYIGSTTFAGWQVVEGLWASEKLHLNRFISEQPPYNLLDRRIERELLPVASGRLVSRSFRGVQSVAVCSPGNISAVSRFRTMQGIRPPTGLRWASGRADFRGAAVLPVAS